MARVRSLKWAFPVCLFRVQFAQFSIAERGTNFQNVPRVEKPIRTEIIIFQNRRVCTKTCIWYFSGFSGAGFRAVAVWFRASAAQDFGQNLTGTLIQ